MKTFREYVESHEGQSPKLIATKAIKEVPKLLIPMLIDSITIIQRANARYAEHAIIQPFLAKITSSDPLPPVTDEIMEAFRNHVSLGDGIHIEMLELTIEQHQRRIAYLEKYIVGCNITIAMHRKCVTTLQKEGASTMRELLEREESKV